MKIVKVTYTTKEDFAPENAKNIEAVMTELRESLQAGINYSVCMLPDNKTFMHLAFFQSDADQAFLNGLHSFRQFQERLKASIPEHPPVQELLSLVGASKDIF